MHCRWKSSGILAAARTALGFGAAAGIIDLGLAGGGMADSASVVGMAGSVLAGNFDCGAASPEAFPHES